MGIRASFILIFLVRYLNKIVRLVGLTFKIKVWPFLHF